MENCFNFEDFGFCKRVAFFKKYKFEDVFGDENVGHAAVGNVCGKFPSFHAITNLVWVFFYLSPSCKSTNQLPFPLELKNERLNVIFLI